MKARRPGVPRGACKNPARWVSCMPEVRPRGGDLRIMVHVDDHPPPHVHVISAEGLVKVRLAADADGVFLEEAGSSLKKSDLRRARRLVMRRLTTCWEVWNKYHDRDKSF